MQGTRVDCPERSGDLPRQDLNVFTSSEEKPSSLRRLADQETSGNKYRSFRVTKASNKEVTNLIQKRQPSYTIGQETKLGNGVCTKASPFSTQPHWKLLMCNDVVANLLQLS
jgi:hypothetical protein